MKVPVKRFFLGGALKGLTEFSNTGLGEGLGAFTNNLDIGATPGSGLSTQAGVGTINDANAAPQDLLNSNAGKGFRDAIQKRQTGKLAFDTTTDAISAIPGVGALAGGALKVGKLVKDLLTKEDEFGITRGQYRRNPDLARTKETFAIGKTNAAIADADRTGAQASFNTPSFQPPAFGRFGMKFRRFR